MSYFLLHLDDNENIETFYVNAGYSTEKNIYPLSKEGRIFYVAADGKQVRWDSEELFNSTPEQPLSYESIRWNIGQILQPGDQLLFKRGDTFASQLHLLKDENGSAATIAGTPDNPITIASYGESDKKPIFTNDDDKNGYQDCIICYQCSNIVIRDLEIYITKSESRELKKGWHPCGIRLRYENVKTKYENVRIVNNTIHSTGTDANAGGIKIHSWEQDPTSLQQVLNSQKHVLEGVYVVGNTIYDMGRIGIYTTTSYFDTSYDHGHVNHNTFKDIHYLNNVVHHIGSCAMSIGLVRPLRRNLF